jgi:hypothetical protein
LPGLELLYVLKKAIATLVRKAERQVLSGNLQVGARRHARLYECRWLGGKHERPLVPGVVKRLYPKRITRTQQHLRALVDNRKGPHSPQACDEVLTPLQVGSGQHLGIGRADECLSLAAQLLAQLPVIVDLAVEHYGDRSDPHRLRAALGQIDDREPPMRKTEYPAR